MNNGFDVAPHTKVFISKQYPPPRQATIDVIRKTFNNDESIQLMKDNINEIRIDRRFIDDNPKEFVGEWYIDKRFLVWDNGTMSPEQYEMIVIHELDGHAFFQWAVTHRTKLLEEFCKLANKTNPITKYISEHEKEWRGDDTHYGKTFDYYVDEQHSAMAELDHMLEFRGKPYHKYLIDQSDLVDLLQLYRALHSN